MNKTFDLNEAMCYHYIAHCKESDGSVKSIHFFSLEEFLDKCKDSEVMRIELSRDYNFTIKSMFSISQTGDTIEDEVKNLLNKLSKLADAQARQVFLENSISQSLIDYIYLCGRQDGLHDPTGLCSEMPSVEKVLEINKEL